MQINVFDNGYVTDEVSTIPTSQANTSEENRIKFVTDCAAISRGKAESNNPQKRYQHLLKEAAPNSCSDNECKGVAGRPLEFLPVVLDIKQPAHRMIWFKMYSASMHRFAYLDGDRVYTNARAILNSDVKYNMIPFNTEEELEDFKVVRVKAPYFVFAQIRTHCMISQIAASARVIEENEIWLPEDFKERLNENWESVNNLDEAFTTPAETVDTIRINWKNFSTYTLQTLMRELGYKREVWQRYPQHALYKTWVMAGWLTDSRVWEHFFLERGVFENKYKNWVQPETQQIAKAIHEVMNKS